jgi:hypothetical protein
MYTVNNTLAIRILPPLARGQSGVVKDIIQGLVMQVYSRMAIDSQYCIECGGIVRRHSMRLEGGYSQWSQPSRSDIKVY